MSYVQWLFMFGPRDWLTGLRLAAREMWDDLPGPWWVKVLLVIACLAIPGSFDEVALLAVTRAWRAWRKRRAAQVQSLT